MMTEVLTEVLGWAGSLLFSICGAPQAWSCWKAGNARGLDSKFLWLWAGGEICFLLYVPLKHGLNDLPLLANYIFNFLTLCVIMKYKYFERR